MVVTGSFPRMSAQTAFVEPLSAMSSIIRLLVDFTISVAQARVNNARQHARQHRRLIIALMKQKRGKRESFFEGFGVQIGRQVHLSVEADQVRCVRLPNNSFSDIGQPPHPWITVSNRWHPASCAAVIFFPAAVGGMQVKTEFDFREPGDKVGEHLRDLLAADLNRHIRHRDGPYSHPH